MSQGEQHSGIPTRAIHEAYLDMQRALKRFRQAKDGGSQAAMDDAHGDVQEGVLTFFELLRPHLRDNKDYWEGRLPNYNGDNPPDPDGGTGVLEVQQHNQTWDWKEVPISADVKTAELREASLEEWHDHLEMNGSVRLTGVMPNKKGIFISSQRYQLGLRELDTWTTDHRTKQTKLGGFLGSTTTEEQERMRVNISKLKRAARELSDAAKEMGFLPEQDVPDNDDALPI